MTELIDFLVNNWNIIKWFVMGLSIKYFAQSIFIFVRAVIWVWIFFMRRKSLL